MAKQKQANDPATSGVSTNSGTGGGTPTPPKPTPVKDFKDGKKLRDGSTADAKYTALVTAENADDTVTTKPVSSALFDEQALDPYEVSEAERERDAVRP